MLRPKNSQPRRRISRKPSSAASDSEPHPHDAILRIPVTVQVVLGSAKCRSRI